MKKNGASGAPSISFGSIENDEENVVESETLSEEPSEEQSEEAIEEFSEEIMSRPLLDEENDCSKKSIEELDEGSDYDPSEDSGYQTEQPDEVLSGEEEVEQTGEKDEESLHQPYSGSSYQNDRKLLEEEGEPSENPLDTNNKDSTYEIESVTNNSNEKKRSLDAKVGDYHLVKKCKPDQSVGIESEMESGHTPHNLTEISEAVTSVVNASGEQTHSGSSGKRRRSRWDPQPECSGEAGENDRTSKKRKSRWAIDNFQLKMLGPIQLPDFMKKLVEADLDPEIQELKEKLSMINRRLQSEVHDDRPVGDRSPSPPPIYDDFGIRTNSRDARFHEKLLRERQIIIASLIEKNPTFNPPTDYKPPKLYKKLYIPLNEYPGYNFIGLIIGPRGHTQKRMEKETGARIMLRGKGASMKPKKPEQKSDPSDNEDLHVLIEADSQKSLDEAVGMVEKLLIPVDEGINEHKRAQLRELAKLNGNLRDENLCRNCGECGHMECACPSRNSLLNGALSCDTCGGSSHSTVNCPLTVSTPGSNLANQQKSSLADLGAVFSFNTPQISSRIPWQGGNTGFGISPSFGSNSHSAPGSTPTTDGQSSKPVDDSKLFVCYLPQTLDDTRLWELFTPYGRLIEAKVIKDRSTGNSKGYGFVKYDNPTNAATAVTRMNGYKIDGKTLAVRTAGKQPTPVPSRTSLLPPYQGPAMVSQDSPSPTSWPGPPGSMLADPQFSSTKSNNFHLPHSSVFLGHSDSSSERSHSSQNAPIASPSSLGQFPGNPDYRSSLEQFSGNPDYRSSLEQFPGNPDYRSSQHPSYFTPPSSFPPELPPTQSQSSSISPFSWTPIPSPGNGPFHYS